MQTYTVTHFSAGTDPYVISGDTAVCHDCLDLVSADDVIGVAEWDDDGECEFCGGPLPTLVDVALGFNPDDKGELAPKTMEEGEAAIIDDMTHRVGLTYVETIWDSGSQYAVFVR